MPDPTSDEGRGVLQPEHTRGRGILASELLFIKERLERLLPEPNWEERFDVFQAYPGDGTGSPASCTALIASEGVLGESLLFWLPFRGHRTPGPLVDLQDYSWMLNGDWREEAYSAFQIAVSTFGKGRWERLSGYAAAVERQLNSEADRADRASDTLSAIFRGTWAAAVLAGEYPVEAVGKDQFAGWAALPERERRELDALFDTGRGPVPAELLTPVLARAWATDVVRPSREGTMWSGQCHRRAADLLRLPSAFEEAQADAAAALLYDLVEGREWGRRLWFKHTAALWVERVKVREPHRDLDAETFCGWIEEKNQGGRPVEETKQRRRYRALVELMTRPTEAGGREVKPKSELPPSGAALGRALEDALADVEDRQASGDSIRVYLGDHAVKRGWEDPKSDVAEWGRLAVRIAPLIEGRTGPR